MADKTPLEPDCYRDILIMEKSTTMGHFFDGSWSCR